MSLKGPVLNMFVRAFLAVPLGAVALLLIISVVGIPLGIPLAITIGLWVSKPLRRHPLFNIEGDAE